MLPENFSLDSFGSEDPASHLCALYSSENRGYMKDYELVTIPNEGTPTVDMICMTVSEKRVGVYPAVLDALDRPDYILIRRGVRHNEGKLIIEGTDEYCYGAIPINYERKRFSFYNKEFVDLCKERVEKYGDGAFKKGIFYTVRGELVESGIEFDFHKVMYREVKSWIKRKKNGKYVSKKSKKSAAVEEQKGFNPSSGFSMPMTMGGRY